MLNKFQKIVDTLIKGLVQNRNKTIFIWKRRKKNFSNSWF